MGTLFIHCRPVETSPPGRLRKPEEAGGRGLGENCIHPIMPLRHQHIRPKGTCYAGYWRNVNRSSWIMCLGLRVAHRMAGKWAYMCPIHREDGTRGAVSLRLIYVRTRQAVFPQPPHVGTRRAG